MASIEYFEQKDILGYRGERVLCTHPDCRPDGDKIMWKILYEIKTEPRQRIPKDEEDKILNIIRQHIMNYHPNDKKAIVTILRMKA